MDLVTLGAALNGSAEQTKSYVEGHFVAGTNIQIDTNSDGTQTISATGDVSSEDTYARTEIANHIADINNPHSVTKSQVGLENVDNVKQVAGLSSGTTQNNLVTWGVDGYTVADSGVAIETSISDSDAKIPTSKAVKSGLAGKQDTIADLATIEAGAAAGATAVQPGDIGTAAAKDVGYFATSDQGGKADSAIQGIKVNSGSAITPDANKIVDITVNKSTVGLSNVDDNKQVRALSTTPTENALVTWGANGYTIKNSGKAVSTTVASTSTDNDIPTAKAVYTEVNKKQDKLTFDDAPTNGSSNPVKSGGIYTALSGKEDTIADLSDIRTGAGKGATAIQSVKVNNTALTPDANKAVDITAVTGVKGNSESSYRTGQVSISKTNIGLSNLDNYKQVRALSDTPTSGDIVTWGANGYTVADSGKSVETSLSTNSDTKVPTSKAVSTYVTGLASSASPAMDGTAAAGTSTDYARADHVHPTDTSRASATAEAEDRAALAELVDGGAKNALPYPALADLSGTLAQYTTINSDGTLSITLETELSSEGGVNYTVPIRAGTYRYTAIEGSSTEGQYDSYIQKQVGGNWTTVIRDNTTNPGNIATLESGDYRVTLRFRKNLPAGTYTVKPMLCSPSLWLISPEYVPYRPSYQELYDMVKALQT